MWSKSAHVASRLRARLNETSPATKMAAFAAAGVFLADSTMQVPEQHESVVEMQQNAHVSSEPRSSMPFPVLNSVFRAFDSSTTACGAFGMSFLSKSGIRRSNTFKLMENQRERETLESRYTVEWREPIGEGSFGAVYQAEEKKTGELVAVKKISKRATDDESFQREMEALLHIRSHGGHPNICGLRANYDQGDYYYLVLDLVSGGEMFDHLCNHGAYSEADAARLIREVASALAFLHGLNTVHGDLKPENCTYCFSCLC